MTQGTSSAATRKVSPPAKQNASAPTPSSTTEYLCPVCDKPLELYNYTKENQKKQMLRCSDVQARRQDNHEGSAFFLTYKGVFWSSKHGEVGKLGSVNKAVAKPHQPIQNSKQIKKK